MAKKKHPHKAKNVNTPSVAEKTTATPVTDDALKEAIIEEATVRVARTVTPKVSNDELDSMVSEFRTPKHAGEAKIVEPTATGTADALTSIPKVRPAVHLPDEDDVAVVPAPKKAKKSPIPGFKKKKRNGVMAFLGAIVPRMGDGTFDVVRKLIMIAGIVVFVGAATYLVDDLVLIPYQNQVMAETLNSWYNRGSVPELTKAEAEYQYYPEGIDPAFKKLYYNNNDVRGWLSFHSTDSSATINVEYPILQSADNDFYLYHDFNKSYNKNGSLFFDYRNDLNAPTSFNYNTIVYGHNMASGQMLANLNKLLYGVNYARVAPTFTMDTLYGTSEYKVFAVMVINTNREDGNPFGYLQTDFPDIMSYATFLANIRARSLYDYNDVDVRPDDQIVMLSTCNSKGEVHFTNGRTVVVARKVRDGESAATDVNKIVNNNDVIMPYGWYKNQEYEPHPYYVDASYNVPPLDTLQDYLNGVTSPTGTTTTLAGGITLPTAPTTTLPLGTTTTAPTESTQASVKSLYIEYTPKVYALGSEFDYANTKIFAVYTDGSRVQVKSRHCAIENFSTASLGTRFITIHYGAVKAQFKITVVSPDAMTTAPSETTTTLAPDGTITTTTTSGLASSETTTTLAPVTPATALNRED
ncbi:MAG: class B sortase [Clostridia bacterium]|nr:class B sortase [Clostridia bacterium]